MKASIDFPSASIAATALGIKLVAADSPQSFLDDTPTSKLIRQIAVAFVGASSHSRF
jgi:hypothetical protein